MTRFSREFLAFLLIFRGIIGNCANIPLENNNIESGNQVKLLQNGGFQDELHRTPLYDLIERILNDNKDATSNVSSRRSRSNSAVLATSTSSTGSSITGNYGDSSVELTTVDGNSMTTSTFSDKTRRLSIDSSMSDVIKSKMIADIQICQETENSSDDSDQSDQSDDEGRNSLDGAFIWRAPIVSSGLLESLTIPTVYSEIVSDESDGDEKPKDCFDGWAVHRVSMSWVAETFIPYLKSGYKLLPETAFEIVEFSRTIFSNEATIFDIDIEEDEELYVVGDIHGQFDALIGIFEQNGYPSANRKYIFNGDIVDRGPNSIECLLTLLMMKICVPSGVYITRGNHESHTCGDGTFKTECFDRMAEPLKFFLACHDVFNVLPLGYTIKKKYFVCHGGLPNNLSLEMIQSAGKPEYTPAQQILAMALLWNDPHDDLGMRPSKRGGATLSFGRDITCDFLSRHNLELLIRSHEYHKDGHFYCQEGQCLTVFSAPNYCGIGNKGCVVKISHNLERQIIEMGVKEENLELSRVKERSLTLNLDEEEFEFPFHDDRTAEGVENSNANTGWWNSDNFFK